MTTLTAPPCSTDPEMWFTSDRTPEGRADVDTAKRVCQGCPLREPCLDAALAMRPEYGIWGGLDPNQRRRLQRRRSRA